MHQQNAKVMSSAPYLEIQTPDGRRRLPVGDQPVTIGRHPENRLVISDPLSSRRHCVIEKASGAWRVRDLNSSNGTRVNGSVIEQSRLLPGDIVSIGATRIVLVVPAADAEDLGDGDAIEGEEDIPVVEEITEDDEAEMLSEDDLVIAEDEGPIHGPTDDEDGVQSPFSHAAPGEGSDANFIKTIRDLAESL